MILFFFEIFLNYKKQWIIHTDNQMIIHFGMKKFLREKILFSILFNRILVPSDSVGAIIGKQGSTVKQIKQTAHAKYIFDILCLLIKIILELM